MIFVRDKGQMCNNILQYGHVYAWGREHGRKTMSMRFAYKYQYFRICETRYHWFITYMLAKFAAYIRLIPVVSFNDKGENTTKKEQIMGSALNVMVEGWEVRFYDLFLKYKDEIIKLFAFKEEIRRKIERILSETASENPLKLGIHIRRGDYKTWYGGKYFFDDDTYIDYIRSFINNHKDRNVSIYICGNDPRLDKAHYRERLKGLEIVFPAGNPGEDLCLLSKCDYLIGPPSTFTLVASMYHDTPLCWMERKDTSDMSFSTFDTLFRKIK